MSLTGRPGFFARVIRLPPDFFEGSDLVPADLAFGDFKFDALDLTDLLFTGLAFAAFVFIGLALEGLTFLDLVFAFTAFAFFAMFASTHSECFVR